MWELYTGEYFIYLFVLFLILLCILYIIELRYFILFVILLRLFCCFFVGWVLSLVGDVWWVRVVIVFRLEVSFVFSSFFFSSLVLSILVGNFFLEGDIFIGVMFRDLVGFFRRVSGDLVFGDLFIRFIFVSLR